MAVCCREAMADIAGVYITWHYYLHQQQWLGAHKTCLSYTWARHCKLDGSAYLLHVKLWSLVCGSVPWYVVHSLRWPISHVTHLANTCCCLICVINHNTCLANINLINSNFTYQEYRGQGLPYLSMVGRFQVMTPIFEISIWVGPYFLPHHDLIGPLFLQKKVVCLYHI